jgi:hypothetical protein
MKDEGRGRKTRLNARTRMLAACGLVGWMILIGGWMPGLCAAQENTVVHRVQPGDTLPRLCWQYKVRLDALGAANPGASDPLTAGQRLVIPLWEAPTVVAPAVRAEPETRSAAAPMRLAMAVPVRAAGAVIPSLPAVREEPAPEASEMMPPPAAPTTGRWDFLGEARRLSARGLRYNGRWTPPGQRAAWVMDCSNTSRYLYQAVAGIDIGRTASDQYYFLRQKRRAWDVPMGWDGHPKLDYLRTHLRVGDLLFWENTYKPVRKPDITHVMVFLGEDAQGRWQMAGSQTSQGVNIYRFDAQAPKGGYSSWFGLVHHEGRFVAYGRPLLD